MSDRFVTSIPSTAVSVEDERLVEKLVRRICYDDCEEVLSILGIA